MVTNGGMQMSEIQLRDYQMEVYNKIKDEFRKGRQGVGACLACRAGKSYIFRKNCTRCK